MLTPSTIVTSNRKDAIGGLGMMARVSIANRTIGRRTLRVAAIAATAIRNSFTAKTAFTAAIATTAAR